MNLIKTIYNKSLIHGDALNIYSFFDKLNLKFRVEIKAIDVTYTTNNSILPSHSPSLPGENPF